MVLEKLTDEDRKFMFLRRTEDPILQVLQCSLQYSLTKVSLLSQNAQDDDVAGYINRLWDAVCAAHSDGNCLLLQIFNQFLADLGEEENNGKSLKSCVTLKLLQQIFLLIDYSDGKYLLHESPPPPPEMLLVPFSHSWRLRQQVAQNSHRGKWCNAIITPIFFFFKILQKV